MFYRFVVTAVIKFIVIRLVPQGFPLMAKHVGVRTADSVALDNKEAARIVSGLYWNLNDMTTDRTEQPHVLSLISLYGERIEKGEMW